MSNLVGIDLGTTYSAISRLNENGLPVIIHNSDGQNITPSVVSFIDKKTSDVSETAEKNLFEDENTFGRFKRHMGEDKTYKAFGIKHTPTSLSALVLKKLKEDAEKSIGKIDNAVITIPANFSSKAREETMQAAKMAGLNVKNIINEPTAAALYYALSSGNNLSGTFAVYDLGGGTFDISIMKVNGSDIEIIATEGVQELGGHDFDNKICDLVKSKFKEETGEELADEVFNYLSAESIKRDLSKRDKVRTSRLSSGTASARIEITREEFEDSISTMIANAEMLCEGAMDDAGVTKDDITDVILAGGSTRIPYISESVKKVFGKDPVTFSNPDEAVALGAALYIAYKSDPSDLTPLQKKSIEKVKISDISSKYFGTLALVENTATDIKEIQNCVIIKKGEKIPCVVTESFYTTQDGQTGLDCSVTEANTEESDQEFVNIRCNESLPLPGGRTSGQEIQITYSYNDNQIMICSFLDVASGAKKDIEVDVSAGESKDSEIDINDFTVE